MRRFLCVFVLLCVASPAIAQDVPEYQKPRYFVEETYDEVMVIEAENWCSPKILFIRDDKVLATRQLELSPYEFMCGDSIEFDTYHHWRWGKSGEFFTLTWENDICSSGLVDRHIKFKKFTSCYFKKHRTIHPFSDLKEP